MPSTQRWPQRTVLITAVDAQTGEPVVFERHSGIDLADAVATSCASGFDYRIGTSRYIDHRALRPGLSADLGVTDRHVAVTAVMRAAEVIELMERSARA